MVVLNDQIERRARAALGILARRGTVRAAYLFGSHAQGRADEWSDIDLAAFMDGIEDWDIQERARVMASVMREVGADVEVHLLPVSEMQQPQRGGFAGYILNHGIRITAPF